jgi:oligoribonuclease
MNKHQFMWLDIETTCLDPCAPEARILEWAVVLAADDRAGDMSPVQEFSVVLQRTLEDPHITSDFVRRMHLHNGLLDECMKSTITLAQSEDFLLELAEDLAGPQPRGITLAGNSVHFDLAWVRVHMPRFAQCLSHRVFDVSTLQRAAEAWVPGYEITRPEAHRALADVYASLAAAKRVREALSI